MLPSDPLRTFQEMLCLVALEAHGTAAAKRTGREESEDSTCRTGRPSGSRCEEGQEAGEAADGPTFVPGVLRTVQIFDAICIQSSRIPASKPSAPRSSAIARPSSSSMAFSFGFGSDDADDNEAPSAVVPPPAAEGGLSGDTTTTASVQEHAMREMVGKQSTAPLSMRAATQSSNILRPNFRCLAGGRGTLPFSRLFHVRKRLSWPWLQRIRTYSATRRPD